MTDGGKGVRKSPNLRDVIYEQPLTLVLGKGEQMTYWLVGESAENRKIRLARNLAGKYFQSQKSPMSGGSDHQLDLLFKSDLSSIRRESSKCGRSNGSRYSHYSEDPFTGLEDIFLCHLR